MSLPARIRVAFAGAAHSHPFADAENLRERGARLVSLWDEDDASMAAEFRRRFSVPERPSLEALLEDEPDVVVATVRTPRAAAVSRALKDAGIPAFFNKTVAADHRGLAAWTAEAGAPRFTTSVLRFAPALTRFVDVLGGVQVHALDIIAQHDITGFLHAHRRWQDDPAGAGGTLVNIGIHAWEMLDVLIPGTRADMFSGWAIRGRSATASELAGTVRAAAGDTTVSVMVSGAPGPDRYAVRALTEHGYRTLELAIDPHSLGYGVVADYILALACDRVVPVTEARSHAVYSNTLDAAQVARRG